MFIFVPIELLIHILEEYLRFPKWASKHFGTTTRDWYNLTHLIIFPLVFIVAYFSIIGNSWGIFLSVVTQTVMFTNGLFHIFTTFLFKEYSPGVISSSIITLPFSYFYYQYIFQNQFLSLSAILIALFLGVVVSLSIIWSLTRDINFKFK